MSELDRYKPIAEAVSLLLFPHAEVVIHDLHTGCIGAIFNNLSKRAIGDESSLDELDNLPDTQDVFPPYFKINWDGKKMKSVTAVSISEVRQLVCYVLISIFLSGRKCIISFLI